MGDSPLLDLERDNVVYWKTNRKIINDLQLLDLYHHGPEFQERLYRSTICIFGSDSTPLGLLSQSYTNALPSLQTDGP